MEYVYPCKKNGLTYVYTTEVVFKAPQDAYAWRRGVREYADNYLASVSHPDSVDRNGKPAKTAFKGTESQFHTEIDNLSIEARDRFHAGIVPSESGGMSPETARRLANIAAAKKLGWTDAQLDALLSAPPPTKKAAA